MSAAVKKLDGVESVDVAVGDKKATIKCRPNSKTTLEQIRQAIAAAGFTPGDAEAQIVGKVIERDGKATIQVTGSDATYSLVGAAAALNPLVGKTATVTARVPESKDKMSALQVMSVKP